MAASADDTQAQLQQMQKQIDALSQRLEATTDELSSAKQRVDEQDAMIRQAGLGTPQGADCCVSSFFESVEVSGWLSVSYWYNINDPSNNNLIGGNTGVNGQSFPFHPDANQFSFDQLWFEVERPVDEENRAGFYAEFAYGKSAKLLPDGNAADGGNSLYIPAAYIQYMTPLGPTIKVGKFGTLIGYEVAQTVYNDQISRGLVYNLLQPIDHVGVLVEGDFGESGFGWAAGIVNNVFKTQPVVNDNLAYTGRLSYTEEIWSVSLNGIWGQVTGGEPTGDSNHKLGIIDMVATLDPTEALHLWMDATFAWDDSRRNGGSGKMPDGWGVAVGGRYAINERWGAALRGEYVDDSREFFGFDSDVGIWSLTGTVDFAVTDNLTLKGELRYDWGWVRKAPDDLYIDRTDRDPYTKSDQAVVGAELVYRF